MIPPGTRLDEETRFLYGLKDFDDDPGQPTAEGTIRCDPATPPTAPAAEPSSGAERSTARGAGACCESMRRVKAAGAELPTQITKRGTTIDGQKMDLAIGDPLPTWSFCPWCGTKL